MRIIRVSELRRTPWKNGGGETVEMIVHPAGAGLATFDWRISMATVAADGPFSIFPAIDRTLSILDGAGLRLTIGDRPAVTLTPSSPPLTFAGDQPVTATLVGGTITDLNVMSRRGHVRHHVERLMLDGRMPLDTLSGSTAVFCQTGSLTIAVAGLTRSLQSKDCAILERADAACTLTSETPAVALIIRISDVPPATPRRESPR